jgi:DNA-binding response OmpR family regulator
MILIVEDHEDAGQALCQLLTAQGYACRWVATGRQALELVRSHPAGQPLLVVMDDMLPDLPGLEVLRLLREDERTKLTLVIVHSAGLDDLRRDAALRLGAADWIVKGGHRVGVDAVIETIIRWYSTAGGTKLQS